jgi:hypothetical protein
VGSLDVVWVVAALSSSLELSGLRVIVVVVLVVVCAEVTNLMLL